MLEVVSTDYIRTAKAKGLPATQIFSRHQLRNAILPVVTVLGPAIAGITTGGFVVEIVFAIPGLGRYFVQAIQQLDYTVIMGTTVFYGAFLVFMVILVDLFYGLIDPRVRVEMSAVKLGPADFQPLPPSVSVQQITRPSLSYWADAWRRLRKNPRAMASWD